MNNQRFRFDRRRLFHSSRIIHHPSLWLWGALLLFAPSCYPQDFTQRGFLETRVVLYPQTARGDRGRAVGEALLRYEASYKPEPWLRFSGAFDGRTDSHRQVERLWRVDWQDRSRQRPAFALRRLSATLHHGRFTAEFGKQFIRWGKTDILNPTDRFAPRDFLSVVDNDFLAVTAARLTYESGANTLDLVWAPRFTPSRVPLLNQRWTALPEGAERITLRDAGARFPGGPQLGARWNHVGSGFEYSLSFYQGFNHLPSLDARVESVPPAVELKRFYPRMRMYGGDAALPLRWLTVKGEAAYFTTSARQTDEYVLYVVQVERPVGEWFFAGGYAGEVTTVSRANLRFAPDRGLTRAFLGRAGYTIDANRNLAFEAAVRQNGQGAWVRIEYSQLLGQHWRATAGWTWIHGAANDFLGQYRRNSHAGFALRYSF